MPVAVALAAGCATDAYKEAGPRAAALAFHSALRAGDGAAACALLSSEVRSDLEDSARKPCAAAVLEEGVQAASSVRSTAVFDGDALVRMDRDNVFAARFSDGWKVVAAGCTSRGERPYQCRIEGR